MIMLKIIHTFAIKEIIYTGSLHVLITLKINNMPLQPKKQKLKKKVVVKKDKFPVYVATNMTGTSTIITKKRPRTIGGNGYKN